MKNWRDVNKILKVANKILKDVNKILMDVQNTLTKKLKYTNNVLKEATLPCLIVGGGGSFTDFPKKYPHFPFIMTPPFYDFRPKGEKICWFYAKNGQK